MTTKKVISSSGMECISGIVSSLKHSGSLPVLQSCLKHITMTKNQIQRRTAASTLNQILKQWPKNVIEKRKLQIESALRSSVKDADGVVRRVSKECQQVLVNGEVKVVQEDIKMRQVERQVKSLKKKKSVSSHSHANSTAASQSHHGVHLNEIFSENETDWRTRLDDSVKLEALIKENVLQKNETDYYCKFETKIIHQLLTKLSEKLMLETHHKVQKVLLSCLNRVVPFIIRDDFIVLERLLPLLLIHKHEHASKTMQESSNVLETIQFKVDSETLLHMCTSRIEHKNDLVKLGCLKIITKLVSDKKECAQNHVLFSEKFISQLAVLLGSSSGRMNSTKHESEALIKILFLENQQKFVESLNEVNDLTKSKCITFLSTALNIPATDLCAVRSPRKMEHKQHFASAVAVVEETENDGMVSNVFADFKVTTTPAITKSFRERRFESEDLKLQRILTALEKSETASTEIEKLDLLDQLGFWVLDMQSKLDSTTCPQIIQSLLKCLEFSDVILLERSLEILNSMIKEHGKMFTSMTNRITGALFHLSQGSEMPSISCLSSQTLETLACHGSLGDLLLVMIRQISKPDDQKNLCQSIKLLSILLQRVQEEKLIDIVQDISHILVKCFACDEVSIRRATMMLYVKLHEKLDVDTCSKLMEDLKPGQRQLVAMYTETASPDLD